MIFLDEEGRKRSESELEREQNKLDNEV